jgi:hypothetical protein
LYGHLLSEKKKKKKRKKEKNCRRLVGTTVLKGGDEDMSYFKGETCLT